MADLLSYGEDEISKLFPKCRLPTSTSCSDVTQHQRDLIDFSEPGACGSPVRRASHTGSPHCQPFQTESPRYQTSFSRYPHRVTRRDPGSRGSQTLGMSSSASLEQLRHGGSCEPPTAEDSDSSSGRAPPPRESRIELAGGRELYSQSRSRPGKRRTSGGSRMERRPAAEVVKPSQDESSDALRLSILGFQPLRETSLGGTDVFAGGEARLGVGETPVTTMDVPVMFNDSRVWTGSSSRAENGDNGDDSRTSDDRVLYGGSTSPMTVTLTSATASSNGDGNHQTQRNGGRVIGSVPIADYEGSPRRYGSKSSKPGPGFPQRVWQEPGGPAPSRVSPVHVPDKNGDSLEQLGYVTGTDVATSMPSNPSRDYFRHEDVRSSTTGPVSELVSHSQMLSTTLSCEQSYSVSLDGAPTSAVPSVESPLAASDLAAGCDSAAVAATAAASRNFTLSPDTTECDSGEVESDVSEAGASVTSSGAGRVCSAMPVLEDGLSDGAGSADDEPLPPPPPADSDDATAELIRHHLSQLEAASARQPPAPPAPISVPISQSLLPSTDTMYVPHQYRPPPATVMLSQQLLQRQSTCPPVLSAPDAQSARDQQYQQLQLQPPRSGRYDNGDVDLKALDPLGSVRTSPPPPAPGSGSASPTPAPSAGHQTAWRSTQQSHATSAISPTQNEDVQAAIQDIRQTLRRTRTLPMRSPPSPTEMEKVDRPVWIPRRSGYQKLSTHCDDPSAGSRHEAEEGADTDQETDRLLGQQRSPPAPAAPDALSSNNHQERDAVKKKGRSKEVMVHEPAVLIEGVLFRARYLGSTQLVCEGQPTKATRMMQAEEAVSRIKVPDGETQPSTDVDLFISTEKIMVLNTDLKEIMMDHALRTISYIADIGELVVLMARRRVPPDIAGDIQALPKMICHVFESDEAQFIAQSIGQAFQVAYMEFLKANGIEDHSFVKEMDYQEVLNSQEIFGEELKMFAKKELQKEVVVPKQKGEILGVVIVESGWGSLVPTVVIANLAPSGAAARCGLLNIGDQIIAINGVSLVGLPLAACQTYVKNAKPATVAKLTVVPCPPVVEVKIRRPDTKYQLGFSVQNGVICSLLRGGIAERGGVRVGHRIIEINSQSVVAVPHDRIVSLLATSVGEIHMKTMPTSLFRLLTGQESPIYI